MSRIRRRWLVLAVVLLVIVAGAVITLAHKRSSDSTGTATGHAVRIDVVDGPAHDQHVSIDATVYYPAHTPAPAVLVSPGFGGDKDSVASDASDLVRRGFVVLAYSPRGFGRSTGQIGLNSPDYEVADARQLIDWLARQPQVRLDGPGDPRVGVTGGSYGGALSLLLAGTDKRVDAIAPVITYNDLGTALLPNGVLKKAWAGRLFTTGLGPPAPGAGTPSTGDGSPNGTSSNGTSSNAIPSNDTSSSTVDPSLPSSKSPPTSSSTGAVCGRYIAEVCRAYTELAVTGVPSAATLSLLHKDSPVSVTGNIKVPTLLVQGEQDTLFGLDQADANARQIRAAGGTVKMIWYNGGHDGGQPDDKVRGEIGDWFSYHLAHTGTDPGTGFDYVVPGSVRDNGVVLTRTISAPAYPGLTGGQNSQSDQGGQRQVALTGREQQVINPPGGTPAAISGMPGLSAGGSSAGGSTGLASRLATDVPGEFAEFDSTPLPNQLQIAGSPEVRLRIRPAPGTTAGSTAVLFVKLYDVNGGNGQRTLPGSAVAPIKIASLPRAGTDVTVPLAGIVAPVQAGHKLALVVSTTDQSFAPQPNPASYLISIDGPLSVPVVPGTTTSNNPFPTGQLIAIAVLLGLCLLGWLIALTRRGRADDVDDSLADVPLALHGLGKTYRGGLRAVDDLSFTVERGQVVGLLGPNGAGKTTALRMALGLVRPSAGTTRVFGHLVRPGAPVLSRIGTFVERSGFLPHLSGASNLRLYWQATSRPAEESKMAQALEIAGLGDAIDRKVGSYSQGMRQRLAVAQAMLGMPDLLVLDEPTNGLDPPQIRDMRDVLRRYVDGGRTVLISSHLLAEVEQTCSHVVVMHKGKLIAAGEVGQIIAGGGQASFTVDDPDRAVTVLSTMDGVTGVAADGDAVHADLGALPTSAAVRALVDAGIAVTSAGPRRRLEDAFLHMVGAET